MNVAGKRLAFILAALAVPVLMVFSFVLAVRAVANRMPAAQKKPVSAPAPDMFPILVLTPATAGGIPDPHLVYQKDLAKFLEAHPDATFLVPDGADQELNRKLDLRSRYRRGGSTWKSEDPWMASFKVKRLGPAHQELEVDGTWDDDRDNVGWYEVRGKEIIPRFYKFYFGPGLAMASCLPALGITVALWSAILITVFLLLKRRRRTVPAQLGPDRH